MKPQQHRGRAPYQKRQSEYDDKVIEIRRVSRVVKGGKRFSFRATVVLGNKRGKVGVGIAKGLDVPLSIEKAKKVAEKNIFVVPLKEERTIPYDVEAKYAASKVRLKPTRKGHGLIAGGSSRIVLDLAGVKDISAKMLGRTTNKLTNAMATIEALKKLKPIKKQVKKEEAPKKKANEALPAQKGKS
ncbi:30S ribosomal protein S5 [bacterium]|nr:30S ribosomal protein S5 [bacterium]|tara:strand:- start:1269 stop:1826 length:558 start_codon:yes stop_codon:yes gene_type:complete